MSLSYPKRFTEAVISDIFRISWKCKNCGNVRKCEEDNNGNKLYCLDLITAVLMLDDEWTPK